MQNTFNITINAGSLSDESELRQLSGKICRLLSEEIRRYNI
jgi:hypothetical protein